METTELENIILENKQLKNKLEIVDLARKSGNSSKSQQIQADYAASFRCPDSLKPVWESIDVRTSYKNLSPKNKKMIVEYLENGRDVQKAYEEVYGKLEEGTERRAVLLMYNPGIKTIIGAFKENTELKFDMIEKVYQEAMGAERPIFAEQKTETGERVIIDYQPDHIVRQNAAEKMAKLNGLLVEKTSSDDKKTLNLNVINPQMINTFNQFLQNAGQKPIVAQSVEDVGAIGGGMAVNDE